MSDSTVQANGRSRLRTWAMALAVGALLARSLGRSRKVRAARRADAQARPLHTWEGEGGTPAPGD